MKLPDGSTLMHGPQPYDPAKAREYYLRTRKLKGRKKGQADPTSPQSKKLVAKKRATPKERAAARQTVINLTKKLSELNAALKAQMSDAKAKGRKSATKAKTSAKEAAKPPSAADKAGAARDAKKYADKNKQTLKTKAKQANAKTGGSSAKGAKTATKKKAADVGKIKKEIKDTQAHLKDAVAKYRALG